ncbi:Uncharacterised protein [Vibrio cholerae]|nr:Uncharacterised protein [Vibrio cholerae]
MVKIYRENFLQNTIRHTQVETKRPKNKVQQRLKQEI